MNRSFLFACFAALPLTLIEAGPVAAEPVQPITVAQAENDVAGARRSLEAAEKALQKAEDGGGDIGAAREAVANAMKSVQAIETGAATAPPVAAKPAVDGPPPPAAATPAADAPAAQATPSPPPAAATPAVLPPAPEAGPKPYQAPVTGTPVAPRPQPKPAAVATPSGQQPAARKAPVVVRRDGAVETTTIGPDGSKTVDTTARDGRLVRRIQIAPDGSETVIIDRDRLRAEVAPGINERPDGMRGLDGGRASEAAIESVLRAQPRGRYGRTIDDVRRDDALRRSVAGVDLDTIRFESGSARIAEDQIQKLGRIGAVLRRILDRAPDQVFLIEGHTDAVGTRLANQELSEQRAASVAAVLSRDFGVSPANLAIGGYGKDYLKIETDAPERQNRRVTIRNITPLLGGG